MGHNDSKGGGGHGSPPLAASGQLGRGGSQAPGRVEGLEVRLQGLGHAAGLGQMPRAVAAAVHS
jgi:hypothetical protein